MCKSLWAIWEMCNRLTITLVHICRLFRHVNKPRFKAYLQRPLFCMCIVVHCVSKRAVFWEITNNLHRTNINSPDSLCGNEWAYRPESPRTSIGINKRRHWTITVLVWLCRCRQRMVEWSDGRWAIRPRIHICYTHTHTTILQLNLVSPVVREWHGKYNTCILISH